MTLGLSRGHLSVQDDECEIWRWADGNEDAEDDRACWLCEKRPTAEGHDPCIANLPGGVFSACCGHGRGPGYVVSKEGEKREYYTLLPYQLTGIVQTQDDWFRAIDGDDL